MHYADRKVDEICRLLNIYSFFIKGPNVFIPVFKIKKKIPKMEYRFCIKYENMNLTTVENELILISNEFLCQREFPQTIP